MEVPALVELLRESNVIMKGTRNRYLKPDLTVVPPDPPPAVDDEGKPLGNVLALRWIDLALRLQDENRELRHVAQVLFLWIIGREHLASFALASVAARFEPAEVRLAA